MKVWIDQDLCTGDGLCEEIAPDVFTLLDDGLAYVVESGKVFAETQYYVPAAKAAARALQARPGEKPERIKLLVESMTQYNTAINFTSNTERARQIYRPELSSKAYLCTESAQQTLDGVKKQVEDALIGQA